jgi:hypothetical protein
MKLDQETVFEVVYHSGRSARDLLSRELFKHGTPLTDDQADAADFHFAIAMLTGVIIASQLDSLELAALDPREYRKWLRRSLSPPGSAQTDSKKPPQRDS